MVILVSYVSSQHLCRCYVVTCLHVNCDEPDPGFLKTLGSAWGLVMATISIQVQCPDLLWVLLPFELVCDDPRNTVLIDSVSLSHSQRRPTINPFSVWITGCISGWCYR